ncbi:MAG: hypothetical protein MJZ48_04025 [Paludibacteraceae bacterium]|nr:hypothetical protein [Paludibacteraceae bacterium]
MKKLFSLLTMLVLATSAMMAATTFTYSTSVAPQTKDGFTVELGVGDNPNKQAPAAVVNYTTQANEVRMYVDNVITISGASITGVELTFTKQGSKDYATLSASTGNLVSGGTSTSIDDPKTDVWTGSASSITFALGTKGQRILTQIVVYGEGGDTPPTPPTPSGDVTVTGLNYVDAIFYEDETYGDYWSFDFYNDLDEENYIVTPYVYFVCNESTTAGTKIAGTWTAYDAGYFETDDEASGVYTDEEVPVGSLTVTCVSTGVYNFVGSFVGEDGKTYTWTLNNMEVYAYNGDTYEEITLTDGGGTPTPPTPVGQEITIAEAEAIARALADNETTTVTYTIKGYVGTLFESSGDFYLVEEAGGRSDLEVYHPTVDRALTKGDYVQVVGKLQKYISKQGKTILEVVNATVTHISPSALMELPANVNVKKLMLQHKVLIMHNGHLFNMAGERVK